MRKLLDRLPGTSCQDRSHDGRTSITRHSGPLYLTVRQLVVAGMTADGSSCRDIALELSLPLHTVQGHLHGVLWIPDLLHPEDLTHELIAAHRAPPVEVPAPQPRPTSALGLELAVIRVELERQRVIGQQLTCALASRDSIGQAKGILMERYKISADAAFAVLERESSRSNRKLVDVVECLLFSGETGRSQARSG